MFFASAEFQAVVSALNEGFLKTVQLFFVTLIGALPLGLVISFGSMNRWAPWRARFTGLSGGECSGKKACRRSISWGDFPAL